MDREVDIAALFAEQHAKGGAELLVRAPHEIRVDRAAARRSARGQKAFSELNTRLAQTQVRWPVIHLPVPQREFTRLGQELFPLNAVHVIEPAPLGLNPSNGCCSPHFWSRNDPRPSKCSIFML